MTTAFVAEQQELDLIIRDPRPVECDSFSDKKSNVDAVFLMTDPSAWEERNPFPSAGKAPRPPNNETSQLPIGVTAEVSLPPSWGSSSTKVRVAGIGHGGVFTGSRLSPVREKLLLVLPSGELHEFLCSRCATSVGKRTVSGPAVAAPPVRGRAQKRPLTRRLLR